MTKPQRGFYRKKNHRNIFGLPVLQDNITWIWSLGKEAVVIDPAIAAPVEIWLKNHDLNLIAVLQTHHHSDHIGGTKGLLKLWPKAEVIAAKKDILRIPFQTISVTDGDQITLMNSSLQVIEVPGHTKEHIAFFLPTGSQRSEEAALFCGDTLFGAGCGRLFEGSPEEMYLSLKRLSSLPKETKIYCAHEYTEANLLWATGINPSDKAIKDRLTKVREVRLNGELTLPSNMAIEISTNLFLRAKDSEELSKLRKHKDHWKG